MPTEVSQKLLLRRYGGDNSRKDIHERDRNYIEHCYNAALYAAEKLGWERISCAVCGSDEPRTIEDIAADVYAAIKR